MNNLIAFSGKMTSGKTTLSEKFVEEDGYTLISIGSMIKKVSSLLVQNTYELNKYLHMMIESPDAPRVIFTLLTKTFDNNFSNSSFQEDGNGGFVKNQAYRELTQFVATSLREILGEDIWVSFLAKEAQILVKNGEKVVCDDLRLPTELSIFKSFGFKTIRIDILPEVQRERILKLYGEIDEKQLTHVTEVALDDSEFDFRFDNSFLAETEAYQIIKKNFE